MTMVDTLKTPLIPGGLHETKPKRHPLRCCWRFLVSLSVLGFIAFNCIHKNQDTISFHITLSDFMVLQQAPAVASVYGHLDSRAVSLSVTVRVTASDGQTYSVPAEVDHEKASWRAVLRPTGAGGDFIIEASVGGVSIALKNVTFGNVWYCSGQSNMALPLKYTLSRNHSKAAIEMGKYSNIRMTQMKGNMNPNMPWMTVAAAVESDVFFSFSATCYYFAESLTDALGEDAPPIGLIHTSIGGSTIQQWLPNSTIAKCDKVEVKKDQGAYYQDRVLPYTLMTIKGWVWYQAENNMHDFFGNSIRHTGYSCLIVELVRKWRSEWTQNTASEHGHAPFGVVALPDSGSEGGNDVGSMRLAQTASYGVLPNKLMPNTFLAQIYDLNDPYGNITCYRKKCCVPNPPVQTCHECEAYCANTAATPFYMGPIHPRVKKQVGQRLGLSYLGTFDTSTDNAATGPTFECCVQQENKIKVFFNRALLRSEDLTIQEYNKDPAYTNSQFEVLVNASAFCMQTFGKRGKTCIDDGYGVAKGDGKFERETKVWVPVDISPCTNQEASQDRMTPPDTGACIIADLTKSKGIAFAIRYGFGDCCHPRAATSDPCPISHCPIVSSKTKLPANPFVAKLKDNKCDCLPPQQC